MNPSFHQTVRSLERLTPERILPKGIGRPPVPNRKVLEALVYCVLSGLQLQEGDVPDKYPSYRTLRRRLAEWQRRSQPFAAAWAAFVDHHQRSPI